MAQSVLGKINYLTEEQYIKAKSEGRINPDEIYMTPDDIDLSDRDTSPIGTIHSYAGSTEPKHWLFCDGRELSRLEYKRLFDVIGTTYGEGDGITTFNLPDLRGRIPVGVDSSQDEFTEVGKSGGSKFMQAHSHAFTTQGHNAKIPGWVYDGGSDRFALSNSGYRIEDPGIAGTGDSENLQPYLVLNYIIKYEGGSVASDAMPEITIGEVETLAPGSQATADISGTILNPVINLGIPQGNPGENGKNPDVLDVLKAVYPVGSIYLSVNNTNPSSIFGFGTWVKESGGYLYGCVNTVSNSDYTGLNTQSGGSGTSGSYSGTSGSTTLTADQSGLPAHSHKYAKFEYKESGTLWGCKNSSSWGDTLVNQDWDSGASGGTAAKSGHTHSIPSHTHSIPAHTHNVAHIGVFIWKRTA